MLAAMSHVAVAVAVLCAVALVHALRRRLRSRRAVRRARRALAGEAAASSLLAGAGYQLLDTQVRHDWTFHCDGEPVTVELRCDALVAHGDRRLVAEIKTGERAPALATAATRRQLLEYAVAYRADGVVLVDAEAGAVREVDFALAAPPPAPAPVAWFVAGLALGAVVTTALVLAL
jgi:hypothetical protein